MAYTDELFRVVDEYFMEIIMPYGRTNAEAGEYLKKFKPFQKKNYDSYLQRFEKHKEEAEALTMANIAMPEEDTLAQELKEKFAQSQKTFVTLCERNVKFYDLQNRRAQRKRVTSEELKEIFVALQAILNSAMRDVTLLEDAYKELKASLDPEYAKEYAAQKAELAEKRARQEAEMAEREAKQANRKESRTAKKLRKIRKQKLLSSVRTRITRILRISTRNCEDVHDRNCFIIYFNGYYSSRTDFVDPAAAKIRRRARGNRSTQDRAAKAGGTADRGNPPILTGDSADGASHADRYTDKSADGHAGFRRNDFE